MSPTDHTPRSGWLRFQQSRGAASWGSNPDDLCPERLRRSLDRISPLFHPERGPWPATVEGWDNLPGPGALVIGNHSGGTVIPDVWGLMAAWYRQHGVERPLHGLAHEMVFGLQAAGRFFAHRGILRASRAMAQAVLVERKRDLLVLPGGDLDTWRPFSERWTVNFHGRKGYARTSLQTGAPIVPVAHAGAHHTLIVLDDGQRLAELLHLPELFRAHIFPVHLSLPYGLAVGPLPHVPPPTRLRYRVGAPVVPPRLQPGQEPSQAQIDAHDAAVRAALQAELDILKQQSDAVLDRVEDVVKRARGTLVRLRNRDLEPGELARVARKLVAKGRRSVRADLAAK